MSGNPEFHRILVLNTSHVTKADSELLDEDSRITRFGQKPRPIGLCASAHEYGNWVYVTDCPEYFQEEKGYSESMTKCLVFALKHGAQFINFDSAGPRVKTAELDIHTWKRGVDALACIVEEPPAEHTDPETGQKMELYSITCNWGEREEGTFSSTFWAPDCTAAIHLCRREMACSEGRDPPPDQHDPGVDEEANYFAYLEQRADEKIDDWDCIDSFSVREHMKFLQARLDEGPTV